MKRYGAIACAAILLAACGSNTQPSPTPVTPPNTIVFTSQLSAANEVPPVSNAESNGRGSVTITFNLTRDASGAITAASATFVYSLSGFPGGTTLTASHIHNNVAGQNAGIFISTTQTAASGAVTDGAGNVNNVTFQNITVSPASNAQLVIDNPAGYYFNVHTQLNGGGAVRGQLTRSQ
jgi:hypothetical protein